MQKLRAVIFDVDGTLANTVPLCIQSLRQTLEPQLHRPLPDEEIVAAFGPDEEGAMNSFSPPDLKKATADFMHNYESLHDEMCPQAFDGMKETLDMLTRNGVRLAIATGKGKDSCLHSLDRFGLLRYFDQIEYGAPGGSRKPEAIEQIVHVFGVKKEEVVYVGDTAGDIKESRKAGIAVVAAAWAATADRETLIMEQPDEIFDSVAAFATWLEKHI